MLYHRNAWYVAALGEELSRNLLCRVLLETPVVLYRKKDGSPVALADRCPHRFAPLSLGKLIGDVIQCRYHGLCFDGAGTCVDNPHGPITRNMEVASYPLAERYGLVWIWMGDPQAADPSTVPDLSYIDDIATYRCVNIYMLACYRYDILVDNLLDISHADFLHAGSFSSGVARDASTDCVDEGETVLVIRKQLGAPPPSKLSELGPADMEFRIRWHPGQVIDFELRVAPAGHLIEGGQLTRFTHFATPQDASHTHYFAAFARDHRLDDAALDEEIRQGQTRFIETEDSPMLEAIGEAMAGADLLDLRPVVLPTDKGALQVRRKVKKLLQAEAAPAVAQAPSAQV